MIVVLDYGMGNLRSVEKAIEHLGFSCRIQPDLAGASKVLIPGVGAFAAAMERLAPLRDEIQAFAASGKPLMGICLGQQLLFEESDEMGTTTGLGLLPGRVKYLPPDCGLKIPHMGWSPLTMPRETPLMKGVKNGAQVYFVHSLYCEPNEHTAALATYGVDVAAAVCKGNIWGTQFHPEKSGDVGLSILRNFLEC